MAAEAAPCLCSRLRRTMTTQNEPTSAERTDAEPALSKPAKSQLASLGMHELMQNLTPLGLVLGVLVSLGIYLRLHDFGYPSSLQFDEHHFVETARGYLKHQSDWNDHPPLGKLLILIGISVWGDNSVGFRLPSLIAGLLTIVLGASAAHRLFRHRWSAFLAAALLAADGFLIAYSRAGLLDGFLVMASVAALLLVGFELSLVWGCLAGLVLGFATSVKFSGIGVILPLLFAVAISKQKPNQKLAVLASMGTVAAFVYISTYGLGLSITGKPSGMFDVFADTQRLFKHHSDLTDMKNPATSGWSTWFLPKRPLLLGIHEKHGAIRALSTLGNLATWWSSVALAVGSLAVILRLGWARVLSGDKNVTAEQSHSPEPELPLTRFVVSQGQAVIAILLGAIGFLAPWILTHRDSYIYHFLPAYAPLVLLLSGFLSWYEQQQPNRVFYFAIAVLLVAAFYAPLWGYLPISSDALSLRLFLNGWR